MIVRQCRRSHCGPRGLLLGTADYAFGSNPPYGVERMTSRHFASENSVGVLPVTCRKACENAGTLA
jgi:hypothetical protein